MNAQARFEKIAPVQLFPVLDHTTNLMWSPEFSAKRLTFADAHKYIAELNAKKHCGFDDWRMPTRSELLSLVDDTRCNPAIDPDAFPGCPSERFWSSTEYAGDKKYSAWFVHFNSGYSAISYLSDCLRVRAVRGPARQSSAFLPVVGGAW